MDVSSDKTLNLFHKIYLKNNNLVEEDGLDGIDSSGDGDGESAGNDTDKHSWIMEILTNVPIALSLMYIRY